MKTTSLNLLIVLFMVVTAGTVSAWTTPVPLTELNTPYGEGWLYLSSDGLTLYFSRGNTSDHYWHQLYQATRTVPSGSFSNVTRIDELAYNGHVHSAWVSPDNLRMYFMRTEPGSIWRLKVSTRTTVVSKWGAPQNLTELNNLGDVAHPRLSADELTIVFNVFERESIGYLYTASRSSRNLPFTNIRVLSELNTSMDTRPTYLSADGLTLYFVRNDNGIWHNYVSMRSSFAGVFGPAQLLNNWSENYGLGCFSADGQTAYLGYNGDFYISNYEEPNLVSIEIAGPNEVAEDTETRYKAIAYYDNGSNRDITSKARWSSDECDFAGVDANGLFWCDKVFTLDSACTIYAEIEDGNSVFAAQKQVRIVPMCSNGSALQFDGAGDYVDLGNNNTLKPQLPVTITAWINYHEVKDYTTIINIDSQINRYYGIWLQINSGCIAISYGNGGLADYTGRRSKVGSIKLEVNKWHFVVAVINGFNDIKLYINGVEDAGYYDGAATTLVYSTQKSLIGNNINRYFFDGLIDNIAVFSRALSAEEIQYNMNNKLSGSEAGLVGYWDFDEGQGQVAHDKSGKGNNGILGGTEKIESSDPAWFSLGHPCSRNELIKRNLGMARQVKADILADLNYALKAETASQKMLMDMQREKDFSLWKIFDIVRARVYTQIAVLKEYAAQEKIQASDQDLLNALKTLEEPEKKIKDNQKP